MAAPTCRHYWIAGLAGSRRQSISDGGCRWSMSPRMKQSIRGGFPRRASSERNPVLCEWRNRRSRWCLAMEPARAFGDIDAACRAYFFLLLSRAVVEWSLA